MKKQLLILTACIASYVCNAQIVNGNFETWTSFVWDELDTAQTSNGEALVNSKPANATKVTPAQNGSYALKLETSVMPGDTNFAYALFGSFGNNGPEGGFPYTQKPATLNGYFKSNIVSGDSALILVNFRKAGASLTMDIKKFGTSQSAYTAFSMPLSISTYSVNPDSVVLVLVSSVPTDIDPTGSAKDGTWIIFDNLSFGGSGITQQVPNTNFEIWSNITIQNPTGWTNWNIQSYAYFGKKTHADRTTDKYKGNYALKLLTVYIDSGDAVSHVTNGINTQTGSAGGVPFTNQIDTLIGYYKYIPNGIDTASIGVEFSKLGSSFDNNGKWLLPASSYTYFEIPINLSQAPDTVRIDIGSSGWPVQASNNGSVLYIDEIQWKSAPLNTGISESKNNLFGHIAFPSPAKNYVDIAVTIAQPTSLELSIYDLNGKLVYKNVNNQYPQGRNVMRVNTGNLATGNYTYTVISKEQNIVSGKFMVD